MLIRTLSFSYIYTYYYTPLPLTNPKPYTPSQVNMRVAPLWISPLTSAACFGAPVEALAKLVEAGHLFM